MLASKKAGWKIIQVPQAKIWHKGVQMNYDPSPLVTYYSTRNQLLFLTKHQAPLKAKIYTWVQSLQTLLSWTVKPKWKEKRENRDAMWQGLMDFRHKRFGKMPS